MIVFSERIAPFHLAWSCGATFSGVLSYCLWFVLFDATSKNLVIFCFILPSRTRYSIFPSTCRIPNLVRLLSYGWVFYIPEAFLFCVVFSSFFITAWMDPGIIPKQPPPVGPGDSAWSFSGLFARCMRSLHVLCLVDPWVDVSRRPPSFRDIMVGNFKYQQKYCGSWLPCTSCRSTLMESYLLCSR